MNRRVCFSAVVALLAAAHASAARLNIDLPGVSIPLEVASGYSNATLTLSMPDGRVLETRIGAGSDFKLSQALIAGQYRYRVDFAGAVSASAAGNGADGRSANSAARGGAFASVEGAFRFEGGHAYVANAGAAKTDAVQPVGPTPNDVVTADDSIVQGSLCVGLDCIDGEPFGFDTIRLKENNTRIHFQDTSTGAGFASTNWQLTANDSVSGGLNKFSIEDLTATTVPFTVLGGAPTDSLYVDNIGRAGFGTSTPSLKLHAVTSDTPGLRLDQNGNGGFTPQVWDVAGNEANFFVRDLTGGSRLPFRIRPGAPTSSIDIATSGYVGFGIANPAARIDVLNSAPLAAPVSVLRIANTDGSVDVSQTERFVVDSSGNVLARGTISQLSSRAAKENFQPIDNRELLAKLDALPVSSWNYRGAPEHERHVGPVAEDFHAAFELGASNRYIAPTDMAGVALASVKALQEEIRARDTKIEQLEDRLRKLEARLDAAH
jgi:hypothetical protein